MYTMQLDKKYYLNTDRQTVRAHSGTNYYYRLLEGVCFIQQQRTHVYCAYTQSVGLCVVEVD